MTPEAIKKAATYPDEVVWTDMEGQPLDDDDPTILTQELKEAIAYYSIKWHQSFETTLKRIIMTGVRKIIQDHERTKAQESQ